MAHLRLVPWQKGVGPVTWLEEHPRVQVPKASGEEQTYRLRQIALYS